MSSGLQNETAVMPSTMPGGQLTQYRGGLTEEVWHKASWSLGMDLSGGTDNC